jgi:Na+/proline symporter
MTSLNLFDWIIILLYLSLLIFFGLYLRKRASGSLEDYFIGGRKMPWWAMGISGMASYIDMAGTMLIVSFLYMLGPRGLYIEFRGGAALVLTFMMLWSGKWHYRSGCITGAEWMEFRFGKSWGGQFARIISGIAAIITSVGMLAYLIKALGMFTSMFFPFSPAECALIMVMIGTMYTIIAGFYGVVYIDLFQALFVGGMILMISVFAWLKISETPDLALLAQQATGNAEWTKSFLKWQVDMPKGYEAYQDLTLFAFFYLLRNIFFGISSAGADPRYFGARSERECGTMSSLWIFLMMFRWPMMIGFAVLGLFLVNSFFPDQTVLMQTADLIKSHLHVSQERWTDVMLNIGSRPESYPPELINGIKGILHDDWQTKLHLLSYYGTINAEQIVPAVILFNIPMGLRGIIFIAFIAAALSSFNSNVNSTTAYFTRDLYQRYMRREATNKELLKASYIFAACLAAAGYLLAYNIRSINQIWGWIAMGLGGGLALPSMLKFYWWRYNGSGFAIGVLTGIIACLVQVAVFPHWLEWQQFTAVSLVSLIAALIGTYAGKPTDEKTLSEFYTRTRPFGFWKPYKNKLAPAIKRKMEREHRNDIIAAPFTLCWQISIFLLPMQFILGEYGKLGITIGVSAICIIGMYYFWYRNLPKNSEFLNAVSAPDLREEKLIQ